MEILSHLFLWWLELYAKIKYLSPSQFHNIDGQAMISNGFHLPKISYEIQKAAVLSKYSGYNCPTITDSGNFKSCHLVVD